MSSVEPLRAMAQQMQSAIDEVRQIEPFTARSNDFDLAAAYDVAQLMHEARLAQGAVAVGRKIGFTNPDMWSQYGVGAPVWAPLYDSSVRRVTGQRATCSIGRYAEPKIEPEIVFHFRSAPPVGGNLEQILDSIDWVAHGFEIVQSHFAGWRFKAPDVVADSALHATLLIGAPQTLAQLGPDLVGALASFSLTLMCNDEVREVGAGSNVLGSPLAAIAHLLGVLANQPQFARLQGGEIVTTGTITTAHAIQAGETWRSELAGIALPGLSVEFTR